MNCVKNVKIRVSVNLAKVIKIPIFQSHEFFWSNNTVYDKKVLKNSNSHQSTLLTKGCMRHSSGWHIQHSDLDGGSNDI